MLTQEQIKNLKLGDPVIIEATFFKLDYDGDVIGETTWTTRGVSENCKIIAATSCVSLPSEHGTSVPTTKHDPCRLFREGDKVRVVEWHGRHFHDRDHGTELTTGCICEVKEDETETITEGYQNILVTYQEQVRFIQPCFLEIVTPAEELKPYYVERQGEKTGGWCYTVRKYGGYVESTFYFGECRSRDEQQAKAAAEAECKRLNAEYRKEQNNA